MAINSSTNAKFASCLISIFSFPFATVMATAPVQLRGICDFRCWLVSLSLLGCLFSKEALFCGRPTATRSLRSLRAASAVVSFDLDDTLWPQVEVIEEANQQIASLHATLSAEEVQGTMRRLRQEPPWEKVSYCNLRCAAYAELLDDTALAEEVLQQWISARNHAGAKLLYPDVMPCLEGLASSGAIVGAITNGAGNPRDIPALANFFHFSVSAQEETMFPHRKPSPVIFQEALERARSSGWTGESWWHVGDDLATDVAAAARVGLRTVHIDRPNRAQNRFSLSSEEALAARQAGADSEPDLTVSCLRGLAQKILQS
ncbi:Glyceraldehyde 3-phosphate phosphatase [Durusdinium trenchii]